MNIKLTNTKQRILGAGTCLVASILLASPSYGISISELYQSIISDIKGEIANLKTQVTNEIESAWAGIKSDALAAINDATGVMGTPDPIASGQELKEKIASEYSLPVAQGKAQDLERQIVRGSISALLNKDGQQDTSDKISNTTSIASEAKSIADNAQNMDASQNILKAIASQNALVVSMLAQQRTDSLQARQDNAYSNLMMTQTASNLAAMREKENVTAMGQASLTQEVIAMSNLDPAYIKK